MEGETLTLFLQGANHQQRAETGTANTDPKHVGERLAIGSREAAVEHLAAKGFNPLHLGVDVRGGGGVWCQLWGAQPVVANLALFIRIGDRTTLQGGHRRKGQVESGSQGIEIGLADRHATHIEPDTKIAFIPKQVAEALPLDLGVGAIKIGKHGLAAQAALVART